jgi:hypothetical protein
LTLICLGIGLITTGFYYCNINEIKLTKEATELDKAFKRKVGPGVLLNPRSEEFKD